VNLRFERIPAFSYAPNANADHIGGNLIKKSVLIENKLIIQKYSINNINK